MSCWFRLLLWLVNTYAEFWQHEIYNDGFQQANCRGKHVIMAKHDNYTKPNTECCEEFSGYTVPFTIHGQV